ncbi:MAG: AzlC family ABC transporter permease [Acidimicrobiales bacterium]|nr:AzlC family ABC transporter permease [Acidimicrobiales bacterium]
MGQIIRSSILLGLAVGIFGLTFGVLATASGLTVAQSLAMSLLTFTGASQFAFVGLLGAGGGVTAALLSAVLLAARNGLYAASIATLLPKSLFRKALAAQLVIDESTAMATAQKNTDASKRAFWATGLAIYLFWSLGTLLGALCGDLIGSPDVWGLDAAFPAGFVALLVPHLRNHSALVAALSGAVITVIAVPVLPIGVPVLLGVFGAVLGCWHGQRRRDGS